MATAAMDYETADGERYDGKHAPRPSRPVTWPPNASCGRAGFR